VGGGAHRDSWLCQGCRAVPDIRNHCSVGSGCANGQRARRRPSLGLKRRTSVRRRTRGRCVTQRTPARLTWAANFLTRSRRRPPDCRTAPTASLRERIEPQPACLLRGHQARRHHPGQLFGDRSAVPAAALDGQRVWPGRRWHHPHHVRPRKYALHADQPPNRSNNPCMITARR